ncbi:hypothetical protein [Micromonospora aurantiaca]|nr:hypothetical protein [Micromonospora aurantiaca]
MITPLGCSRCGTRRQLHDAPDHTYRVPDMTTVLARAAALKTRRAA